MLKDVDQLLRLAAYTQPQMDILFDKDRMYFSCLDPVLGYLPGGGIGANDGIDDCSNEYTLEPGDNRARKTIHYADRPCRINTYGDSYTLCAQAGDAETWQEVLAANFREPMRNFGVGGYGVYQAYRRAMRVEAQEDQSAEYMILNIWDDDHLRSIDAARWNRVAWIIRDIPRDGPGAYGIHGFPWAHVRYNVDKGTFDELPSLCQTPEELQALVGQAYCDAFKDDLVVHLFAMRVGGDIPAESIARLETLAEALGLQVDLRGDRESCMQNAARLHDAYGIKASQFIVDKWRAWARERNKKLMVLLSYDVPTVIRYLESGERFDEDMVTFLEKNDFAYMDCLKIAAEDFKVYNISAKEYVDRLYVPRKSEHVFGHYSCIGYHWFAHAVRRGIVEWLDPKPPAYQ